jgi:hypothetical protein
MVWPWVTKIFTFFIYIYVYKKGGHFNKNKIMVTRDVAVGNQNFHLFLFIYMYIKKGGILTKKIK